ncbi:hypothetical protein KFU94_48770 [Chloroflexi bacterium TSY]|nr:hypothetical protein [Chloroflexi bacterium TSY]
MNAVEAAEQLIMVGRQMQALEQRLHISIVDQETWKIWHELLMDPAERLAALLTVDYSARSAPQSADSGHSAPFFPLDTQTATMSPADLDQNRRSARVNATDMRWSTPAEDAHSSPSTPNHLSQPSTPTTPSVRLTRDRSSLLSILNANVRADSQPVLQTAEIQPTLPLTSQAPQVAATARPDVRSTETRTDLQGTPAGDNSQIDHLTQWVTEQTTVTEHPASTQDTPPYNELVSHTSAAISEPESQEEFRTETNIVRSAGGLDADMDINAVDIRDDSTNQQAHHTTPVHAPQRPSTISADAQSTNTTTWSAATPMYGTGSTRPDPTNTPLSDAQIEQILNALDERLELMLLRTYGTSGPA